jgi:hypothetical protein
VASVDLYSAVVTSVPFLLLGVLATDTDVFGPGPVETRRGRRVSAATDAAALLLLACALLASIFELSLSRDDALARSLAGYGLGIGALLVFGHVGVRVALLYRGRHDAVIDAGGMTFLAHGEMVVVETESDHYLGTVEVVDGQVVIRSGLRGHPTSVPLSEVMRVTPAADHECVE